MGNSHANGGIPLVVVETGQHIEVEGKEPLIPAEAMQSDVINKRKGTNKEILHEINEESGAKGLDDKATEIHAGDAVVCVRSTEDPTEREYEGTDAQIVSAINESGGCNSIASGAVETKANGEKVQYAEGGDVPSEIEKQIQDLESMIELESDENIISELKAEIDKLKNRGIGGIKIPSYLMTLEEYQKKVTPILQEYYKFIKKNEQYFVKVDYGGIFYYAFEELLSDVKNNLQKGSRFRRGEYDKSYTPEEFSKKQWSYHKTGNFNKNFEPDQTPIGLTEKKNEYIDNLRQFYSEEEIIRLIDKDETKSNKRSVRRAIDNDVYANLLKIGKVKTEDIERVALSVGVKLPKKAFDEHTQKAIQNKSIYEKVYESMPSVNRDVLSKMVDEIKESFKPLEKIIYERETKRYEDLILNEVFIGESEIGKLKNWLPFYEDIFFHSKPQERKIEYRDRGRIMFHRQTWISGMSLKNNWKKIVSDEVLIYIESLKVKFIQSIISNFEKVTLPIENIKKVSLRVGVKGFQGSYEFNFKNGGNFIFKTEAIGAGGYNIQRFHYRYLSNFIDIFMPNGEKGSWYDLMKTEKLESGGVIKSEELIKLEPPVHNILGILNNLGYEPLIVGGAVRDAIMGITPKDIDIEVYKVTYDWLSDFLSKYGNVNLVGKSFGVIKFKPTNGNGMDYDFSVPRKENKVGVGHKDFNVTFDVDMKIIDAAARRDFTINSLAYNPITNKIYDFFGGVSDIENKIIRHTSDKFSEDSLRILRALQFQARFDFSIHPDTIDLMKEMLTTTTEFSELATERVYEEWKKWAEKGINHSLIFQFMRDTSLIDYYPELKKLKETPQDAIYHPEGDVEIHTTLCLAHMDKVIEREKISGNEKIILVMSILFHDIAKPDTTEEKMKRGRLTITSEGHEAMGGKMCLDILPKLGFHSDLVAPISNIVANHLAGVNVSMVSAQSGKVKAVKKLSRRLYPATIKQLLYVMESDTNGRGSSEINIPTGYLELSEIAKDINVSEKQYEYILMGRHLIEAGLKPSAKFGEILSKGNEAQENGEFSDIEGAKMWLKEYLRADDEKSNDEEIEFKDGGLIKVKSFKTDEGKFAIYDTEKGGARGRVDMFTVLEDKKGWIIRNAFVPDTLQKQGIASSFYKKMNEESIKKTGKPLRSTQQRTLNSGEIVHELSKDGIRLWDSLVKNGYAEKLGEKNYVFKNSIYLDGGKIVFDPKKIPSLEKFKFAEVIRAYYPKVWFLGGNTHGNKMFYHLRNVIKRGYWLPEEEWIYKKWQAYHAQHHKDYRIVGIVAMLKWLGDIDDGWAYMKKEISEEVRKRYPDKAQFLPLNESKKGVEVVRMNSKI